ncbi:MAG: DMT family transporter [Kouleothrix sp.]
MGVLFGLAAAFCWGVSDFVVTRVARSLGVVQAFFYVQLCGIVLTSALLLYQPGAPTPTPTAWLRALVISIFNLAGTLLLYRSFAIGTLALVSPIASGFAVVSALLALLAGERPALLALVGAVLLIGGVMVVSRGHGSGGTVTLAGVPEALGVALCFGIAFWAIDYVTPALGLLWPVLVIRLVEFVSAIGLLAYRNTRPATLDTTGWVLVFAAALLDTLAFVAFNLGVSTSYTTIVTALAALFSAVTVVLAWALLRERLALAQWVGVAVILCGVLLVSL